MQNFLYSYEGSDVTFSVHEGSGQSPFVLAFNRAGVKGWTFTFPKSAFPERINLL